MSLTCYAPFRRSPPTGIATCRAAPRLACVKPAASVHPEPGSNSSLYSFLFYFSCLPASCFCCRRFRPPGLPSAELTLSFHLSKVLDCTFRSLVNDLLFPRKSPSTSLSHTPFPERDCKGTPFFFTSKLFSTFLYLIFPVSPSQISSSLVKTPDYQTIPHGKFFFMRNRFF